LPSIAFYVKFSPVSHLKYQLIDNFLQKRVLYCILLKSHLQAGHLFGGRFRGHAAPAHITGRVSSLRIVCACLSCLVLLLLLLLLLRSGVMAAF
jgi:hypothetical protein